MDHRIPVKNNQVRKVLPALVCIVAWVAFLLPSCKYDVEEELYPPKVCDTVNVSYSQTIAPIIAQQCAACHAAPFPISGIFLDNYEGLKEMVDANRLIGALRRLPGYSSMPQDAPALPECDILTFEAWVANGAPNN
jgi:hypothetical protein